MRSSGAKVYTVSDTVAGDLLLFQPAAHYSLSQARTLALGDRSMDTKC